MYSSILLPIDLNHSHSWEKALPTALSLAGSGGTVHLLGVVHDLGMAQISSFLPKDFERKALVKMEEALEAFAEEHAPKGASVKVHVGHGHVPETILAEAGRLSCDLIIIASEPHDDLRNLMVGSAATKVVRHAPMPVLAVR